MEKTAKELVQITQDLLGNNGRAFPTQREIRTACGDTGSFKRMSQALLTVQIARGVVQEGQQTLDKDFAEVLATMSVPTVMPTFSGVTGIPEAALAAFREGVVLMGAHVERNQAELMRNRMMEKTTWEEDTKQLREQVNDLVEALDESHRSARETEKEHAAELSTYRERSGVLQKALEFVTTARDDAHRDAAQLAATLGSVREELKTEIERRHVAETRAATLEARIETRETMEQKATAPTRNIRARGERKPSAT